MLKFFKFDWFSSKERKELLNEIKSVKELVNKNNETKPVPVEPEVTNKTVYRNIYCHNDNITVVLRDGTILNSDLTSNMLDQIKSASTEAEIINLFLPKSIIVDDQDEKKVVEVNMDILKDHPDFLIKDGDVFMKGVNMKIPSLIVASFIEVLEKRLSDEYIALKMFWLKLALNGIESSRNDLLNFCRKNDVKITKNGNLVLYRRIVSKGNEDKSLIKFVSSNYYKIKSWKKSPSKHWVIEKNGALSLSKTKPNRRNKAECKGNLKDLYLDLPNMTNNSYTSAHNKGKLEIKVGSIYRIPESEINLDNTICAAGGLHAAAVDYNYSSFGDTPVVVLVNPSKAITVPLGEIGKLRTTEMFIAAVNDKAHGQHFDDSSLTVFDEEYNNLTISELEDAIKNKSFSPASVKENVSPINFNDLESIKNILKQRVINV